MKKDKKKYNGDMLSEYDFSHGIRGKYAKKYAEEGTNLVVLSPKLANFFPDSKAVNDALEMLVSFFKKSKMTIPMSS